MSTPDKPHEDPSIEDTSAADEPTAMWDADALKGLGLDEAAKAHQEPVAPPKRPAPATAAPVAQKAPKKQLAKKKKNAGPSWFAVIALALGLGVGVYSLVRYLLS